MKKNGQYCFLDKKTIKTPISPDNQDEVEGSVICENPFIDKAQKTPLNIEEDKRLQRLTYMRLSPLIMIF